MNRKILGILLFFCLVLPVAVSFLFLNNQLKQVKREVKRKIIAGIDKNELVLLKFTESQKKKQLKWKHSKEFQYNGEMYDIVETEIKGDTTYYWCWWDYKETKLNQKLEKLLSFALQNNPKKQKHQILLKNFFKSLYFSESEETMTVAVIEIKNKYYVQDINFQSLSKAPPIPPP